MTDVTYDKKGKIVKTLLLFSAGNEVAIGAFLEGSVKFTETPIVLQRVMEDDDVKSVRTIEDILKVDHGARERAKALVEGGNCANHYCCNRNRFRYSHLCP